MITQVVVAFNRLSKKLLNWRIVVNEEKFVALEQKKQKCVREIERQQIKTKSIVDQLKDL